jgi:predicted DNA-binding protein (UPF0251 family)
LIDSASEEEFEINDDEPRGKKRDLEDGCEVIEPLDNMKEEYESASRIGFEGESFVARSDENDFKSRQDVDSEYESEQNCKCSMRYVNEVYRLYFEEGLTQKAVAQRMGYKSHTPIQRIFREQEWDARPSPSAGSDIDSEAVRKLYFDEKLTLQEVAKVLGFKTCYPIRRIFKEQRWKTRPTLAKEREIDPEEVYRLYFDERLSIDEVAKYFELSYRGPIQRIFKEQGWKTRFTASAEREIDLEELRRLYYNEKLTQKEVAQRIGKSRHAIRKVFDEMGWSTRRKRFSSKEELELSKKEQQEKHIQNVIELRERLFGTECKICESDKEVIHRKDGTRHPNSILWTMKSLKSLDPDEWVALCAPCHRASHSFMKLMNSGWDDIESMLKELIG